MNNFIKIYLNGCGTGLAINTTKKEKQILIKRTNLTKIQVCGYYQYSFNIFSIRLKVI